MPSRSSCFGFQPSSSRMRFAPATMAAGSPARLGPMRVSSFQPAASRRRLRPHASGAVRTVGVTQVLERCYEAPMKSAIVETPVAVPLDDEYARMIAYALSPDGLCRIAAAEAEIAAGPGIEADAQYFAKLKARRKKAQVLTD
jgi:hypothetical protein